MIMLQRLEVPIQLIMPIVRETVKDPEAHLKQKIQEQHR